MGALSSSWPLAFLWTCALELPIYTLLVGRRFERWWAVCAVTLLLNTATHPVLWFLFPRFDPPTLWLAVAEGWVVIIETACLAMLLSRTMSAIDATRRATLAALAANAFSVSVGLALR